MARTPSGTSAALDVDGTGRRALHLAEVLAPGTLPAEHPERQAVRPAPPSRTSRWTATAGAATLTATVATVAGRAAARSLRRR